MFHMHRDKQFLLDAIPKIENFLENMVHVKVNHDKWRLLSAYDANQYLGAYVRPYYVMPRQRTIDKFCQRMRELEYDLMFNVSSLEDLLQIRARINSYCGLLQHYKSFNLRKKYLNHPAFYYYFTFDKGFSKAILRPEYGGKHITHEWYKPDFEAAEAKPVPLPDNWFQNIQPPIDLPIEERNALQFLADNYLI